MQDEEQNEHNIDCPVQEQCGSKLKEDGCEFVRMLFSVYPYINDTQYTNSITKNTRLG